jgi:hypothetical protein
MVAIAASLACLKSICQAINWLLASPIYLEIKFNEEPFDYFGVSLPSHEAYARGPRFPLQRSMRMPFRFPLQPLTQATGFGKVLQLRESTYWFGPRSSTLSAR